jgi:hypothetical protein
MSRRTERIADEINKIVSSGAAANKSGPGVSQGRPAIYARVYKDPRG